VPGSGLLSPELPLLPEPKPQVPGQALWLAEQRQWQLAERRGQSQKELRRVSRPLLAQAQRRAALPVGQARPQRQRVAGRLRGRTEAYSRSPEALAERRCSPPDAARERCGEVPAVLAQQQRPWSVAAHLAANQTPANQTPANQMPANQLQWQGVPE